LRCPARRNTPAALYAALGILRPLTRSSSRSAARPDLTGSTLTLSNQARVISTQNTGNGLLADNGAGITLVNSTLTGNTVRDIQLTFGVRADLRTLTIGTHHAMPRSSSEGRPPSRVRSERSVAVANPRSVVRRR
jgi:hypothetical protein